MIVAATVTAVVVLLIAGMATWTVRLLHVGNLDYFALKEKTATPRPVSALDWPEVRVRAVVPQPDEQSVVLLLVDWPAHLEKAATLMVALDGSDQLSVSLLSRWCETQASVAVTQRGGAQLEFRRRQTLERVHATLVAEDPVPRQLT
jgi:hypothetical protein